MGVTPSENRLKLWPNSWVQQQGGQQENCLASVLQPVESDQSNVSCLNKSIFGDLPRGESVGGEPVLSSSAFKDGEKPIKEQEEETSTSSNSTQQRRSVSSHMAVLIATTANRKSRAIQYQLVWQMNKMTTITHIEREQILKPRWKAAFLRPAVKTDFSNTEGLNVREKGCTAEACRLGGVLL